MSCLRLILPFHSFGIVETTSHAGPVGLVVWFVMVKVLVEIMGRIIMNPDVNMWVVEVIRAAHATLFMPHLLLCAALLSVSAGVDNGACVQ